MRVRTRLLTVPLSVLIASLPLVAVGAPAAQAASTCNPANVSGVRVIRLKSTLGCRTIAKLAARTVKDGGYYQSSRYYCRWGGGGSGTIRVGGKTYYGGGCGRKSDGREVSFYARKL